MLILFIQDFYQNIICILTVGNKHSICSACFYTITIRYPLKFETPNKSQRKPQEPQKPKSQNPNLKIVMCQKGFTGFDI